MKVSYKSNIVGNKFLITHGLAGTRIYRIWVTMISRCHNQNVPNYKQYGARGIYVCSRWRNSFDDFYEDMKEGYADNLSLDRIDNNGHYCKQNCKWATRSEQSRNKRNNNWIEINGIRKIKMDWAKQFGISHTTINVHLRRGKTFEQIYNHYTGESHYRNKRFS